MDTNNEIDIVVKKGWQINPDEEIVNSIFRQLIKSEGHCISKVNKRIGHDQCPCAAYLEHDTCYCKLYINCDEVVNSEK